MAAGDGLDVRLVGGRALVRAGGQVVCSVEDGRSERAEIGLRAGWNEVELEIQMARAGRLWLAWRSMKVFGDQSGAWILESPSGRRFVRGLQGGLELGPGRWRLRQRIWVAEGGKLWFPKMDRAFVPAGSRQLVRPYIPQLPGLEGEGCELLIALPRGLKFVNCDGVAGQRPGRVEARWIGGRQALRLDYPEGIAPALHVDIRWGDREGRTLGYQPVLWISGTHGWKRIEAEVTAPAEAAIAHPIVLKWAVEKVVGEAWIDDVRLVDVETGRDVLEVGDFEGEDFRRRYPADMVREEGRGWCLHVRLTEADAGRTRGWWVPPRDGVPVEGGRKYKLSALVRARGLKGPRQEAWAAVLVEAGAHVRAGRAAAAGCVQVPAAGARGMVREMPVEILPRVRGGRLRHIRLIPCYSATPFDSEAVARAYADNAVAAGINWLFIWSAGRPVKMLLERGLKAVCSMHPQPWYAPDKGLRKWLEGRADVQAVWFDGRKRADVVCPTWALSAEGEPYRRALRREVERVARQPWCADFNWDIEQPVVDPPTFCVCERCLREFARWAGVEGPIDAKALLEGETRRRWVAFRCWQNARLMELAASWAKAARPGVEVSVYSGRQSVRTMEHYGVDWELMRPVIDVGMAGYGFAAEQILATVRALKPKPFIGGEMYYLSYRDDARPRPRWETWANSLIRHVVWSGGNGVVIWYLPVFDGAAFYFTGEASRFMARWEDFIARGEHCEGEFEVGGVPEYDWFALRLGRRVMVGLLNFQGEAVQATVKRGGRVWRVQIEPYGREALVLQGR